MAKFTISAYQEMFADEEIEARSPQEAIRQFQAMLNNGGVTWQPSAEAMTFTVSEQDEAGHILSETSSDLLDISVKA